MIIICMCSLKRSNYTVHNQLFRRFKTGSNKIIRSHMIYDNEAFCPKTQHSKREGGLDWSVDQIRNLWKTLRLQAFAWNNAWNKSTAFLWYSWCPFCSFQKRDNKNNSSNDKSNNINEISKNNNISADRNRQREEQKITNNDSNDHSNSSNISNSGGLELMEVPRSNSWTGALTIPTLELCNDNSKSCNPTQHPLSLLTSLRVCVLECCVGPCLVWLPPRFSISKATRPPAASSCSASYLLSCSGRPPVARLASDRVEQQPVYR